MAQTFKRFLIALFAVVVMVSLLATTTFAAEAPGVVTDDRPVCYLHGDANNDGQTTKADAIYILYSYLLGEEYPVTHKATADLDGNNVVNTKDAIYMLYAVLLGDEAHPLNSLVHEYYTPYWSWNMLPVDENDPDSEWHLVAQLRIQCSCGEVIDYVNGTLSEPIVVDATCLTPGSVTIDATAEYTYTVTVNGEDTQVTVAYSTAEMDATYVEELDPLGHEIDEPTCYADAVCANGCGYTIEKLDTHDWDEGNTTREATCTQNSLITYTCNVGECGATKEVEPEDKLAHDYRYVEEGDHLVGDSECEWVKTYKCDCGHVTDGTGEGDTYYVHSYQAGDVTEPTCKTAGSQVFTCENCGETKTETIAANPNAHKWDAGEPVNGVTTHTCAYCGKTKTTVSATNGAPVSKEAIAADTELQLNNNATIKLDKATKDALPGDDVAVNITPADKSQLNLKEELVNQIGGNIYNFTMTSGGATVSDFGGEVTISLPYTLQEGDDVDAIDVWFISDDGNLEVVKGKYAGGFVTFTTNHFSYYTVTRLTPAQRCAVYGCAETTYTHAATCTEDGYSMIICQRCGDALSDKTIQTATGHNYQEDASKAIAPTCTAYGYTVEQCVNCKHTVQKSIKPLGHDLVEDTTQAVAATCVNAGSQVFVCQNRNCNHSTTRDLNPLGHVWNSDTAVTHYVTCTTAGYTEYTCDRCSSKLQADKTDPLGHAYVSEGWTWASDYSSATLKIVCKNDHAHDQIVKGIITTETTNATCSTSGEVTYTASAVFNTTNYSETKIASTGKAQHTPDGSWHITDQQHYRFCTVCQKKYDISSHDWNDGTILKQPTCAETGSIEYTCKVCGLTHTETLMATGIHNIQNGTCADCGFQENTCDHLRLYECKLDTTGLGICQDTVITYYACECGQRSTGTTIDGCNWKSDPNSYIKTLSDGTKLYVSKTYCTDCGLTEESGYLRRINEENCTCTDGDYSCLSVNGQTILELENPVSTSSHPTRATETIDLSQYGLCDGAELAVWACPCGKVSTKSPYGCNTSWDDEHEFCVDCGVVINNEWTYDKQGCEVIATGTLTLTLNDQVVYTCTSSDLMESHDIVTTYAKLDGTSCSDGVELHFACANCDYTSKRYYEGHIYAYKTVTDLSSYGSCDAVLVKEVCACGAEVYEYVDASADADHYHYWELVSETDTTTVETCLNCHFTRTTTVTENAKDAQCNVVTVKVQTYSDNKGHSYAVHDYESRVSHKAEKEFQVNGASCTDGVHGILFCADCGVILDSMDFNEHFSIGVTEYDLSAFGACDTTIQLNHCACGQYTYFNYDSFNCDFRGIDGNENGYTEQCANCGICVTSSTEILSHVDGCTYREIDTIIVHDENGTEYLNFSFTTNSDYHRMVGEFTLHDESLGCEGGYDTVETCVDCGVSISGNGYGHMSLPIARDYQPNLLCGDLDLVTYSCACGEDFGVGMEWSNGKCEWEYVGEDWIETVDGYYYTFTQRCVHCSAVLTQSETSVCANDGSCNVTVDYVFNIQTITGKNAGRFQRQIETEWHQNMVVTPTLLDPSKGCDGGYTSVWSCTNPNCDYRQEDNYVQYGCQTQTISRVPILENENICSTIYLSIQGCACGKISEAYINSNCWWDNWYWDNEEQCQYSTCSHCGLVEKYFDETVKNPGSCTAVRTFGREYYLNGEKLEFNSNYVDTHTVSYHISKTQFMLHGTTCEDGYNYEQTCIDCGFRYAPQWENRGHMSEYIDVYNTANYGMCGGYVGIMSCACGMDTWMNTDQELCNWQRMNDPVTGEGYNYCATCDTRRVHFENGTVDTSTCTFTGTVGYNYYRGGNLVMTVAAYTTSRQHEMYSIGAVLDNPNGTCEDGVTVTLQCCYCGFTSTHRTRDHDGFASFYLDLSNGCGGEIRIGNCACGQNGFFHQGYACSNIAHVYHYETDAAGVGHNYNTHTCQSCGLYIETDHYVIDDRQNCKITHYENITITYQGQTYTFLNSWFEEVHAYEYTSATLINPGTSCEDGVYVNWICTECGKSGSSEYHDDHPLLKVSSIDLSNFGAICEGSALNYYQCACGAQQGYDFDPATQCDLDFQPIDHWIPGVVDTATPYYEEGQHTTEGWIVTDSVSYIIKCGVNNDLTTGTSQTCPLSIRMSEYWLNESCSAVEYQTWQLGYDEDTNTYVTEFTIKTGESHAYHNYVWSDNTTHNADGSYLNQHGNTCSDCGSTDMNYYYYDANGNQTKRIWERINTKNNGETKSVIETVIYDPQLQYQGHIYASSAKWDYVYADGSTYWNMETYSNYVLGTTPCMRDVLYTNSYGDSHTNRETACFYPCYDYVSKYETCTQPGIRVHNHTCVACGFVESNQEFPIEPGHKWDWDNNKQMFVCRVCQLESTHDASGNIVMEDLTNASDSFYTIGYYVKDNLNFYPSVSVVLDDAANSDNFLILNNVGYNFQYLTIEDDGICALTFDKAPVEAEALALLDDMGFTGTSYAIRITFVPIQLEDTLDYSITFDSQTYGN